jgi:hypothetical protein
MPRVLVSSRVNWKNLPRIHGSDRRGSAIQAGDALQAKWASAPRCCHRFENRSTPRSVRRKRDARRPSTVKPEFFAIPLHRERLLLPGLRHPIPGALQELKPWPRNFACGGCRKFPSIRRRSRARFRPPEDSSRNLPLLPSSFRRSLPSSIPPAPWP